MSNLLQDLRYAFRAMAKSPGFTSVALLTLALGIGANTTIFTWVNGFLLNGYPGIPAQDRLVVFSTEFRGNYMSVSYPDFVDFRDKNSVFSGLVAMDMTALSLTVDKEAERAWGLLVSGNYFDALGVRLAQGRGFLPDEDKTPNAHPVAVISDALWHHRFAGDPGIVGKQITLNKHPFTVVGVAPRDFHGTYIGLSLDIYVPLMMQERLVPGGNRLEHRGNHWLDCLAKLKSGIGRQQAQAELDVLSKQLSEAYPNTNRDVRGTLYPIWRAPYGATSVMGPVLLILSGVVALVLLIACANVANLLLARAATRRREIAIRVSLGASRARLVRQLLTESVLLSCMGGATGIALAYWSWDLLLLFMPSVDFPITLAQGLDFRVMAFALALSVVTGLIFGLAPALEGSRSDLVTALKDDAGTVAGSHKAGLRNTLVVAQISLSLLLLIAAGLLLRSLEHAQAVKLGFRPENVFLASLDLFPNGYTKETGRAFFNQLRERIASLPGVEAVSLSRRVPLGFGGSSGSSIEVEGYQAAKDENLFANYSQVSPDYFRSMGIKLRSGREFTVQDTATTPLVAVINEAMANRYWPGKDPVGRRFSMGGDWFVVIGVVETSKHRQLNEPPRPFCYMTLEQSYRPDVTIHVRTARDAAAMTAAVRTIMRSLDPHLPLFNVTTLENHIGAATFSQRLGGSLLAAFGSLALLLAAIGVYGVISFGVNQRTREIGIRMALGARRFEILRMIVGHGSRLMAVGLALGLTAAFFTTKALASLLLGVSASDPATFVGIAVLLAAVSLAAMYIPARRAMRIDPSVALRYE